MCKEFLTYFLLMLIATQSAIALSDAHQFDQSGSDHLIFDETHLHHDLPSTNNLHDHDVNIDSSNVQDKDCQHCCQCHNHFTTAIAFSVERFLFTKSPSPVPEYSEGTFPNTFETLLRPPKA